MNRELFIRNLDRLGVTAEYLGDDEYRFEMDHYRPIVWRLKEDVPEEFVVRVAGYFNISVMSLLD